MANRDTDLTRNKIGQPIPHFTEINTLGLYLYFKSLRRDHWYFEVPYKIATAKKPKFR